MSHQYHMPCACGRHVVVENRKAGTRVVCACGNSLEVPTIRAIAQLARADQVEEVLPPVWTLRQGIIFLGLAIALPASAFTIYLYLQLPTLQESTVQGVIQQYSPAQSWALWQIYLQGMPKAASPETKAVIEGIHALQRWIHLGLVVAILGLLVSASAFFVGKPKHAPNQTRPQTSP